MMMKAHDEVDVRRRWCRAARTDASRAHSRVATAGVTECMVLAATAHILNNKIGGPTTFKPLLTVLILAPLRADTVAS